MERGLPAFAESRDAKGSVQLLPRTPRQIEQSIYFGDRDLFWITVDFYDVIAGANFSLL